MAGVPATNARNAIDAIDIRLLGGFQIRVGGAPLDELRSGRARSLLAFLVLAPGVAHSRQALAARFWPESTDGQARTNLRNVLHVLRRAAPALDVALRADVNNLEWRPASPVAVDVHRFRAALAAVAEADPDEPDVVIGRCRAAVALYTGELLAGDLDDWVVEQRAELLAGYRDALLRLATALIDVGRAADATNVARELITTDPVDESAHRVRIEAHARAGDRASAIRAYHECAATLARELDVGPDPATVALYREVTDHPSDEFASSAVVAGTASGQRLVGRDHEWNLLLTAWQSARPGRPEVVIVSGEAGVGKTRLVEELREHCARTTVSVGSARSYAGERTLGHSVVVAWLRSPDIADRLRELSDEARRMLVRLLPELETAQASDLPVIADEAAERRRLLDAVARGLTASGRPILLIGDDAQWSDDASLELIHYLVRRPLDVKLVVVLTVRFEDVESGHPLVALRDELAVLERLTELRLERLTEAATIELGGELLRASLGRAAGETLFAESEGNPLVVTEMVRAGWDGSGPVAISPRLRAVIDSRFRQLSDSASGVLAAASVVGRPCSAALLGDVSGLDVPALVRGVDELWQRGILVESGSDAYEFSHGKLREAAYDSIGPTRRRALHAAAAACLASARDADDRTVSGLIAAHFRAANRIEDAIAWFHRAALEAQAMFAYVEATQLLEQALELVPDLPADVRHGRELELLSSLPAMLAGVDGYGTARMWAAHDRALAVSSSLGRDLEPSFVRSMVMSALCRDEFGEAAAMAARLRSAAVASDDAALEIESHYLLGISAFWACDLDAASRCFTSVVTRFDASSRQQHQLVYGHDPYVVCLSRLGNTLWFLGRDDEAVAACDTALEVAAEGDHPLSHDTAVIFACVLAIDLGDVDRLAAGTTMLGSLGLDSLPHATKREALLGLLDVHAGRADAGVERIGTALDRCRGRNFYPGFQQTIMRAMLAAHELIGDPSRGLPAIERAFATGGTTLWSAEAHRLRAVLLHAAGAPRSEVVTALDDAHDVALRQGAEGHLRRIAATRAGLAGAG